ncbi:MAG: 3-mercaptopyruvate sulfurtransferase [Xanthobacteraceae bacterium]
MADQGTSRWLVMPQWLAGKLGAPDVRIVDGSFYLPAMKCEPAAEYAAGHIPGAVRFDVDEISDKSSPLPHMLPSPTEFSEAVGKLGISDTDTIVVYDGAGLFASPRVWWTFRLFGAKNVFILDGGLPRWKAEGFPVEAGVVTPKPAKFSATAPARIVAALSDVRAAIADHSAQVVDARPADRFRGDAPEPRAGVRSGHMPGSFNVPSSAMLENGRLASPEKLKAAFAAGGVDINKPIITSCGSGVSAAITWLALDAIGHTPKSLYDGSWSEWGARMDLPAALGDK